MTVGSIARAAPAFAYGLQPEYRDDRSANTARLHRTTPAQPLPCGGESNLRAGSVPAWRARMSWWRTRTVVYVSQDNRTGKVFRLLAN